ncbi:MAG: hypothetical protein WED05_09265 [Candidatus Atabeyarchaeum deiterrae]
MSKKSSGAHYWASLNLIMGILSLIGVMFLPYAVVNDVSRFFVWGGLAVFQFADFYDGSLVNVPFPLVYLVLAGAIFAVIFSALAQVRSMAGRTKILSVLVSTMGLAVFAGSLLIYLPMAQAIAVELSSLAAIGIGLYLDLVAGALLFTFGIVMLLKGP